MERDRKLGHLTLRQSHQGISKMMYVQRAVSVFKAPQRTASPAVTRPRQIKRVKIGASNHVSGVNKLPTTNPKNRQSARELFIEANELHNTKCIEEANAALAEKAKGKESTEMLKILNSAIALSGKNDTPKAELNDLENTRRYLLNSAENQETNPESIIKGFRAILSVKSRNSERKQIKRKKKANESTPELVLGETSSPDKLPCPEKRRTRLVLAEKSKIGEMTEFVAQPKRVFSQAVALKASLPLATPVPAPVPTPVPTLAATPKTVALESALTAQQTQAATPKMLKTRLAANAGFVREQSHVHSTTIVLPKRVVFEMIPMAITDLPAAAIEQTTPAPSRPPAQGPRQTKRPKSRVREGESMQQCKVAVAQPLVSEKSLLVTSGKNSNVASPEHGSGATSSMDKPPHVAKCRTRLAITKESKTGGVIKIVAKPKGVFSQSLALKTSPPLATSLPTLVATPKEVALAEALAPAPTTSPAQAPAPVTRSKLRIREVKPMQRRKVHKVAPPATEQSALIPAANVPPAKLRLPTGANVKN